MKKSSAKEQFVKNKVKSKKNQKGKSATVSQMKAYMSPKEVENTRNLAGF